MMFVCWDKRKQAGRWKLRDFSDLTTIARLRRGKRGTQIERVGYDLLRFIQNNLPSIFRFLKICIYNSFSMTYAYMKESEFTKTETLIIKNDY